MNKMDAYLRSLLVSLPKALSDHTALCRSILYGIRFVGRMERPLTFDGLMARYQISELIMRLMTRVTPREFSMIFPIEKDYEGHRFGVKDYFSTVEMIEKHGWDDPIRDPLDFLWDYENQETRSFLVAYMETASDMRRAHGQPGILEEWAKANGVQIYRMYTDADGKQFLVDQNGRSKPVKMQRLGHLKLVRKRRV